MEARVEMKNKNEMSLEFDALSVNEAFARTVVAAFVAQLNPTLDELSDVKTAVSEAVTNSIIHGYEMEPGKIVLSCQTKENEVQIVVEDSGKGIEDVEKAREPFFTTKPELERSGMGFAFMEAFMDEVEVFSKKNQGTKVTMRKKIGQALSGEASF